MARRKVSSGVGRRGESGAKFGGWGCDLAVDGEEVVFLGEEMLPFRRVAADGDGIGIIVNCQLRIFLDTFM